MIDPMSGLGRCDQVFRHDPENGVYGDCYRTSVANLLGLDPMTVPHFAEEAFKTGGNSDTVALRQWLGDRGMGIVLLPMNCELDYLLAQHGETAPRMPWLLSGMSRNGTNHTVLCCGGEIFHDPAIDKSGIVGPCDDGYFWVEYIIVLPAAVAT